MRDVGAVVWRDLRAIEDRLLALAVDPSRHADGRSDARSARVSDHVRVQGRLVGRRGPAPPSAVVRRTSSLAGRTARRSRGHPGILRAARCRAARRVLCRAGAGRPGHLVAHLAGPDRGVRGTAGDDLRHPGPDRQRGLRAAAAGDRRAARADDRRHGRQHHHAAQAQSRGQRAPGHPGATGPRQRGGAHRGNGRSGTSATGVPGRPSGSRSPRCAC